MLLQGIPHKIAGSFGDIRPALTRHDSRDGIVIANFDQGGSFIVIQVNRFKERREFPNLKKVEASVMVANLRKRGYRAWYEEMELV